MPDGELDILSKTEPALFDVLLHQRFEARLVKWHDAAAQRSDSRCVLVHRKDGIACLGETGGGHQADVARTDDAYTHVSV